jgi:uncharacterized integral membrane protein (TIGR00697 family)
MSHSFLLLPFLTSLSGETLTLLLSLVCFFSLVILFLKWGELGLAGYVILGTVASNLQVLKVAYLQHTTSSMVLGTVIFTSLFWAMALLTEYYGPQKARRILFLSFGMTFLLLAWMGIGIAYEPISTPQNLQVQKALEVLFLPAPGLFIASLIAYFLSQLMEIWLLSRLKTWTKGRFLGTRATFSALVSGFLDHALFSILAWKVFDIQSLSWTTLFWTYILGAYGLRLFLSFGAAPLLHLVKILQGNKWTLNFLERRQKDA